MWLLLGQSLTPLCTAVFAEQFSRHEDVAESTVIEQEFRVQNGYRKSNWETANESQTRLALLPCMEGEDFDQRVQFQSLPT